MINDAYFGKIRDVPGVNSEVLTQFIENVVYKHPNCELLLRQLSDIYVLVASIDAQIYKREGEKTWKDIMNKEQYDILEKNRNFIISYMLITKKHQNIHYIDLFDTIIRKNNCGELMINKYETNYKVTLIPQNIIQSSAKYWAKILNVILLDLDNDIEYVTKDLIDEFIKRTNLNPKELTWDHLYYLCE